MNECHLLSVLPDLSETYRLLVIEGDGRGHYQTLYFDTSDFAFFRRHQSGGRNRFKVRSRSYVDTNLSFLEVKKRFARTAPSSAACRHPISDGFARWRDRLSGSDAS
ncbi:MAG: VTC domain-containing protein [Chloroflexota bacterium]